MDTHTILSSSFLDIIFENRNKAYGAYDLRKTYPKRIIAALVVTASMGLLLTAGSILANKMDGGAAKNLRISEVVSIAKIEPEKKVEPPLVEPPPKAKEEPPKIKMQKLTEFKIVANDKVLEPPPAQDELKDVKIDIKSQAGIKDVGLVLPPAGVDDGKGIIEVNKKVVENEDKIFEKVEIEAAFPGGFEAWAKYLKKKLNGNVPSDNGAPPGIYKVLVKFVVDKTGAISDVKALTNLGFGMEQEAVKVIQSGPNWIPAIQSGHYVTAHRSQPIVFEVLGDEFQR